MMKHLVVGSTTIHLVINVMLMFLFKLSSVDLRKPLEKETAKLKEMKENMREKAPGIYFCTFQSYVCLLIRYRSGCIMIINTLSCLLPKR